MSPPSSWPRVSFETTQLGTPPAPDFCLPNLLAGTVGVCAAPAGIGKTSLLMQLAAAVAAGVPVAGGLLPASEQAGRVVFLATEDPLPVLQRRAHFLVRELARSTGEEALALARRLDGQMRFHSLLQDVPVLLMPGGVSDRGLDLLRSLMLGARLLVLDPIRRFHHCDERDYGQMALLFGLLTDLAASTGCAVIFSHHLPQPPDDEALGEPAGALGSDAFVNATRWVLNLTGMSRRDAQELNVAPQTRWRYVRASFTKSNYGARLPAAWLERGEESEGLFSIWAAEATTERTSAVAAGS